MERVPGMLVRCVITKRIINSKLAKGIYEPGTIFEVSESDFQRLSADYPDCIQEIEMTEQDWINLGTTRARKCQKRIHELEQLYGETFESYYIGVIPEYGYKVDGYGYGGGLHDAYRKTKLLEEDVERFEKQCIEHFIQANNSRHK